MNKEIGTTKVVVVGGGTAGWLTACLLAASQTRSLQVTLVESPNIATIGVGEGTWPSMRQTLQKIGIAESTFLLACDAAFKQGSCFDGWCQTPLSSQNATHRDRYLHPFSVPAGYPHHDFSSDWFWYQQDVSFADALSPQGRIAQQCRAPKPLNTAPANASLNYGYHLDAGKFATLLQKHGTDKLGIKHILENIDSVIGDSNKPIESLITEKGRVIEADLYIDCTGFSGRLIAQHYGAAWNSIESAHINNSALAVQVPYSTANAPIESVTKSTAQSHGWIWDIGLQSRRGVGLVYSDHFIDDAGAEALLRDYVKQESAVQWESLSLKPIRFTPGVREAFWVHNCVAIGLSAGFLEPLEASAIALIETSANFLAENLLPQAAQLDAVAAHYNETLQYHWQRIIDFIKLHYVLSKRDDTAYWQAQTRTDSCSEWLQTRLEIWAHRSPNMYDFPLMMEMFPAASWRYIWFGMQRGHFAPNASNSVDLKSRILNNEIVLTEQAQRHFEQVAKQTRHLMQTLPTHRDWLTQLQNRHGSELSHVR